MTSTESMFEAAISKFVKTVGHESLLPVPNLDQADRCRPLQVVVKKNRRCCLSVLYHKTSAVKPEVM